MLSSCGSQDSVLGYYSLILKNLTFTQESSFYTTPSWTEHLHSVSVRQLRAAGFLTLIVLPLSRSTSLLYIKLTQPPSLTTPSPLHTLLTIISAHLYPQSSPSSHHPHHPQHPAPPPKFNLNASPPPPLPPPAPHLPLPHSHASPSCLPRARP